MNRAFSALISRKSYTRAPPQAGNEFASSTLNTCLSPASLALDPGTTERSSRQSKLPGKRRIACGPAGSQAEHLPKYYAARDNTGVVRPDSLELVSKMKFALQAWNVRPHPNLLPQGEGITSPFGRGLG